MNRDGKERARPQPVAVVSESPLLRRRLAEPVVAEGFQVVEAAGPRLFVKSRRQRPFVLCFLDVRGANGAAKLERCRASRPGERYVVIRERWSEACDAPDPGSLDCFGSLLEDFRPSEITAWMRRAISTARLAAGKEPLENLLLERFREFLNQLGPAPMQNLHDLVWERVERPLFQAVLESTGGNQTRAADVLGIHRNTLRAKLKALGIEPVR